MAMGKPSSVTGVGAPLATREASQSSLACPPKNVGNKRNYVINKSAPLVSRAELPASRPYQQLEHRMRNKISQFRNYKPALYIAFIIGF
jgi:hypothetical protein